MRAGIGERILEQFLCQRPGSLHQFVVSPRIMLLQVRLTGCQDEYESRCHDNGLNVKEFCLRQFVQQ